MGDRLQENPRDLSQLIAATANGTGMDTAQLEKDFWVTEVLRALTVAMHSPQILAEADGGEVGVVFKGGTSLSRAWRITERFSEDVDVLITFSAAASKKSRDRILKALADECRQWLALSQDDCRTVASSIGVKRFIAFDYPRVFESGFLRRSVVLEMGTRGGPQPQRMLSFQSLVAEYAIEHLGDDENSWQEFAPVTIATLSPERTLLEKCSALHSLAIASSAGDPQSLNQLAQGARHYYDIACLLSNEEVRNALNTLGRAGVAGLVEDIDSHTAAGGWQSNPRPELGFAASPAFSPTGAAEDAARSGYDLIRSLIFGAYPTFDECLAIVRQHGCLL